MSDLGAFRVHRTLVNSAKRYAAIFQSFEAETFLQLKFHAEN
jgi:hypothetical protein